MPHQDQLDQGKRRNALRAQRFEGGGKSDVFGRVIARKANVSEKPVHKVVKVRRTGSFPFLSLMLEKITDISTAVPNAHPRVHGRLVA
jgi:hypothetical protein